MKVACLGAKFHAGQVQRIEDGFRALGHEVTPHTHEAAMVFVNNPWFDQPIADKLAGSLRGKLILGVQDLPHHIPDYPIDRLRAQLAHADAVTSISATTAADLLAATGIHSHVISQPIMPVTHARLAGHRKHQYRVLFIGRVSDGNKRSLLAARALQLLDFRGDEVVTVGMEPPPYGGDYWGVASETTLNDLYNSVDFVVCTARYGGMELPVIEAMAAGAVPLCLQDLHTLDELLPADLFPEYRAITPDPVALARFIASLLTDDGRALADLKQRLHSHYLANWAERTSPAGVAARIIETYEMTLT